MTDFYSQNRCVCSTRSHGPLLCAFCLSFHFNVLQLVSPTGNIPVIIAVKYPRDGDTVTAASVSIPWLL